MLHASRAIHLTHSRNHFVPPGNVTASASHSFCVVGVAWLHNPKASVMASSTLRIPESNTSLCAAILNETTVDLFALHREQTLDDDADKTLLLRSTAQEHDIAFSPKIQPLSRYVGLPDRIKATMVSGWELYAASTSSLAKWNVKVSCSTDFRTNYRNATDACTEFSFDLDGVCK